MKKVVSLVFLMIIAVVGLGCDFEFEVESTSVSIGSEFYVRVVLHQTHNRCVLPSFDDHVHADAEGFELLGQTVWRQIDRYTHEWWLKVKATEVGEGWIKVFKYCSKNGYEEEVFKMTVVE